MSTTRYVWDVPANICLLRLGHGDEGADVYTSEPSDNGSPLSQQGGVSSRYFHCDGQGSTRQLSNAAGEEVEAYEYDAFGWELSPAESDILYRFLGLFGCATHSGVGVDVASRTYVPYVARFASPAVAFWPRGYRFAGNRPTDIVGQPSGIGSDNGPEGFARANMLLRADPAEQIEVPLPQNQDKCCGFCFGAIDKGAGKLKLTMAGCKITAFKEHEDNSIACPSPKDIKEGCEKLISRLNAVQGDGKERWALNLCGECQCNWDKAQSYSQGKTITITLNETLVGQSVGILCRYIITGTLTVTVTNGRIYIAGCKSRSPK